MALAPTCSLFKFNHLFPSSYPFKPSAGLFLKVSLHSAKYLRSVISFASSSSSNKPPSPFISEQAVLEAVADFDASEKWIPAVRTFENDLARLTLVGAVDFQQALTAAAADGGEAADEHISSGVAAMVVETMFPGHADDRSTVSTRLFLPARKVKEKAINLQRSLGREILHGVESKNILAMTFRQVVLQQLWSLELALFMPGTVRNMDDLENTREVPVLFTLSSSDERVISEIGEVVCRAVLEDTERDFLRDARNRASNGFLSWFYKRKEFSSRDTSVILCNFLEHEIVANAKMLLERFNTERGKYKLKWTRLEDRWWMPPAFFKLEKIGGLEFCAWVSEFVPSYMLEIDASKLCDVKVEGWEKTEADKWEIFLTHSQMVGLADILDMYYVDTYTLPSKRLSCYEAAKSSNLALDKGSSLLKMLPIVLATGILIVSISVLRKLHLPQLASRKVFIQENSQHQLSEK